MKKELTQTIETRLPRHINEKHDPVLRKFAAHYSRAARVMVARKNRGETINKPSFLVEFGITGRQFNAIKSEVDGLFQSQTSNYQRYILETQQRIQTRETRISQLHLGILVAGENPVQEEREKALFKLHHELRGCHRKIVKFNANITRWSKRLEEKKISVCFGSKDLFKKQYELAANNFDSHDQWKKAFVAKRDSEIFLLGAKDETSGNQSCTLTQGEDGLFNIRLRLPTAFEAEHGKYLDLSGIPFEYRPEKIINAAASNEIRSQLKRGWNKNEQLIERHQHNLTALKQCHNTILSRMRERGDNVEVVEKAALSYQKEQDRFAKFTENNALCDFGKALSYRLKRDEKGWRVIVSITSECEVEYVTSLRNGTIGVDLNEHHLAIAEMDSRGCKVQTNNLYFRDKSYDDTSHQTKSGLGLAIKEIVDLAVAKEKPIVIENLDFKASKSKLKAGKQTTYNKMVSSLVTARFLNILKLRCAERGVELVQVNAAYTSFIGRLKYNVEVNFNIHQAAAMTIARRGMGLTDRHLPKHSICLVRKERMIFSSPKDDGRCDTFTYLKKVKREYDKWFERLYSQSAKFQRAIAQPEYCQDIPF